MNIKFLMKCQRLINIFERGEYTQNSLLETESIRDFFFMCVKVICKLLCIKLSFQFVVVIMYYVALYAINKFWMNST